MPRNVYLLQSTKSLKIDPNVYTSVKFYGRHSPPLLDKSFEQKTANAMMRFLQQYNSAIPVFTL